MRIPVIAAILAVLSSQADTGKSDTEDLTGLSLEELLNVEVVSVSRLSQKTSQAPSSVLAVSGSAPLIGALMVES